MTKLPARRLLRSIVMDAINDREGFDDLPEETASQIKRYQDLLAKLADNAPALDDISKDTLALACLHARIWRESYLDAWSGTKDKVVLLQCQQDIDRVTRTETALGLRYRQEADIACDTAETISIYDLMEGVAA